MYVEIFYTWIEKSTIDLHDDILLNTQIYSVLKEEPVLPVLFLDHDARVYTIHV